MAVVGAATLIGVGSAAARDAGHLANGAPHGVIRDGTFAVGTAEIDGIERPVTGQSEARLLPTLLWYPARGHPGGVQSGAPPDRTHGPYPLLVFSEGFGTASATYGFLLEALASAGFVVAAPTYPDTAPPATLDESDIVNHPADLRFVISALVRQARAPGMLLSGLIASGEIGVLGHSDGADVTLAVAADACCRDLRVRAAAILSGAELTSFGGSYFGADSPPLLVSQGNADPINAPACSAQIYDGAPAPKYYLDLLGASHLPPYVDPGRDREIVAQVLTDFFEGELSPRRGVLAALAGAGNVTSLSRLTHAPTAPQATGFCPGAPS